MPTSSSLTQYASVGGGKRKRKTQRRKCSWWPFNGGQQSYSQSRQSQSRQSRRSQSRQSRQSTQYQGGSGGVRRM
jgi:hypothetical protein